MMTTDEITASDRQGLFEFINFNDRIDDLNAKACIIGDVQEQMRRIAVLAGDDEWRCDGTIEKSAVYYALLLLIEQAKWQAEWRRYQDQFRDREKEGAET